MIAIDWGTTSMRAFRLDNGGTVLEQRQLRSFLSGLLIGHELNDLPADSGTVHLIAAPSLLRAYEIALRLRGHAARAHAEVAAACGCHRLALLAGLLPQ